LASWEETAILAVETEFEIEVAAESIVRSRRQQLQQFAESDAYG